MSDDTRKDARTKFVSLNVRYKSATVDEFIENHSHDVSKGGIFIKTNSPFATGTLLKFEIRLAADQPVIAGVGRVVWKREAAQAGGGERPAGMGVKFIKVDDSSKGVIDKLITTHSDAGDAFEGGETGDGKPPEKKDAPAAAAMGVSKPAGPAVKKTMMGLGAVSATTKPTPKPAAALSKTVPQSPIAKSEPSGGGFFPKTNSEADMPPPEERTMMKQAAELLEEALREAGGSMDEVGKIAPAKPTPAPEPIKAPEPEPEPVKAEAPQDDLPAAVEKKPAESTVAASTDDAPKAVVAVAQPEVKQDLPAKKDNEPEAAKKAPTPVTTAKPETKKEGASSTMFAAVVVVLLLAGAFGAYQMGIFGATAPAATTSATVQPSAAPTPSVTASAPPSASAAPSDSVANTAPEAGASRDAAPAITVTPTVTATVTAPVVTTHPTVTATAPTVTATVPTATATATATTKPTVTATATATATATTKPIPTTKPISTESDNPY